MTIDDLIADLEEYRGIYGGDTEVVVAHWMSDGGKYEVLKEPDVCPITFPDERLVVGIGEIFPTSDDGEREDVPEHLRRVA